MEFLTSIKYFRQFFPNNRWGLIFILCFLTFSFGKSPDDKTGVIIHCDVPNIPIYVDGEMVGRSPIKEVVELLPGWHQISVFPDATTPMFEDVPSTRKLRDVFRMGKQDVLVENGQVVHVTVGYRSIEQEVNQYQLHLSASRWIGFSLVGLVICLLVWIA